MFVCIQVIAREVRTDSNLSSTAVVTIYLEDANDNKPKFAADHYTIPALSELTKPGESIASLPLVRCLYFCKYMLLVLRMKLYSRIVFKY